MGLKTLPHKMEGNRVLTDFTELPTLEEVLRDAAVKKDKETIWKWWDRLWEQIEMVSGTVEEKDCIMYELELDEYCKRGIWI